MTDSLVDIIHAGGDQSCYAALLTNWKSSSMPIGERAFELYAAALPEEEIAKSLGISEEETTKILQEYRGRYLGSKKSDFYDRLYPIEEFKQWCCSLQGESDVYFSLNSFYRKKKLAGEVRHINAFCLDFDFYKLKRYETYEPAAFYEVIRRHLELTPTAVVDSGRGLYVIYAFQHCSYHMDRLYHSVMKHFLKKFEKYGMDPRALNTTQVIRLPGTINSRTGRIVQVLELNDTEYTLQQLAKQLPWSKEQVGVHKKEGKKKRKKVDWDLSKRRPYYKDYYKDFQKLIALRNRKGEYEGYRETLLWIAREKATWLGYTIDESVQLANKLNEQFHHPLTALQVEKQCRPSSNRAACNIDTIIDRLQITAEEQQHMKVLKRKSLKKAVYAKRRRKILLLNRTEKQQKVLERRTRVCELKNVQHLSNARIAEILGVHRSTITKDLKYIQTHPSQFIRKLKDYMDEIEGALASKEFRRRTIYRTQQRLSKWLKIAYTAMDYLVRMRGVAKN